VVGFIISLLLIVVTVVGAIQIITKAGYSPWWILMPLSLPVLWIISIVIAFSGISGIGTYGFFNLQGVTDEAKVWAVLTFLDLLANYALFVVFAFSDWPVMQAARARWSASGGPGRGPQLPQRPAGPGAGSRGLAQQSPSTSDPTGQSAGWYQSGALGAGEQSYWDGSDWTAKRRWSRGAWMDIPMVPVGDGPEPPV
jgi:hypothetical protein